MSVPREKGGGAGWSLNQPPPRQKGRGLGLRIVERQVPYPVEHIVERFVPVPVDQVIEKIVYVPIGGVFGRGGAHGWEGGGLVVGDTSFSSPSRNICKFQRTVKVILFLLSSGVIV